MENSSQQGYIDIVDKKFLLFFQKVSDFFEKWTGVSIFYVAQFFFILFLFFEALVLFCSFKMGFWLVQVLLSPITFFVIVFNFKLLHKRMSEEKKDGVMSISEFFLEKFRKQFLFFIPLLVLSSIDTFLNQKMKVVFSEYSLVFSVLCRGAYPFKWSSLLLFLYFLSCKSNPPKKSLTREKIEKIFEKTPKLQHQTV
jgi:hypothetical protein